MAAANDEPKQPYDYHQYAVNFVEVKHEPDVEDNYLDPGVKSESQEVEEPNKQYLRKTEVIYIKEEQPLNESENIVNNVEQCDDQHHRNIEDIGTKEQRCLSSANYQCAICHKQFGALNYLKLHLQYTHATHKMYYSCYFCPKQFIRKSDVTRHMRGHKGEKPYECDICYERFLERLTLKIHKNTHIAEKLYECDFCHKQFAQKINLLVHKRTHTGEKPYGCDICHKRFTRKHHATDHMRSHSIEKLYACDICHKSFSLGRNLARHKLSHAKKLK